MATKKYNWFEDPEFIKDQTEEKRKAEEFNRQFQKKLMDARAKKARDELKKAAKEGPGLARVYQKGLEQGKKISSYSAKAPTDFDEQEGTPMGNGGLMKLPPQSSTDPEGVGNKGTLSGESIAYIGQGRGVPAKSKYMLDRARKTGFLHDPDQYQSEKIEHPSDRDKRVREDFIKTNGYGKGGTRASFEDFSGEKVSSSQTTGIRSSKGSGRGQGPTEFQMQEMLGQAGEKRDTLMGGGRGGAPTKQQMHELRGEAGGKVNFDEAIYNISQQGDPMDPRARGGDRMTDLKPTSKRAQLEEVDQNNSEITEELIAENIQPGSQEAQDIKGEVGNYMRDESGAFINLDRVQARLTSLETREDDFKTAQLLQGKNRRKFLENRGYVDPDDIVQPTELEKKTEDLKREVGFLEQEEKLAKLLVKKKRKYKDKPDDISSEKLLDSAMAALKNGNPDLAKALARKANIPGIENYFTEKKVDPNAAVKLYGEELLGFVGSDDKKDIAKFIGGYKTAKNRVIENLSGIIDDSAFITGNSKNKNLYRNTLGIDPNSKPYQSYVDNKGYIEVSDPGGGEQTKRLEIPRNLNEGQFWQYITEEAVNTHLRDIYPGFHPLHEKVFGRDKGENTVNEFNVEEEPGKKIDTGEEIEETGSVQALGEDADPLLGVSEATLQKNAPNKIVGFNPDEARDLTMDQLEIKRQELLEATEKGPPSSENKLAYNTYNSNSENLKRITAEMKNRIGSNEGENVTDSFSFMPQARAEIPPAGDSMNAPSISSVILSDKSDQEFTFNVLANARKANSNMNAFRRTKRLEGDYTPKVRQEFFEKKKGKKAKPVLSNGKPVYHIGYGIRLPLNKEEVGVLQMNGLSPSKAEPFSVKNINNKHIKRLEKIEITERQALALMQHRYANHIKGLIQATEGQVNFANLPNNVRAVIFDMAYNIGPNFLTRKVDPFKNLRASLSKYSKDQSPSNLEKVAFDIKDSKYYRSQVRNRATKNIGKLLNQAQN